MVDGWAIYIFWVLGFFVSGSCQCDEALLSWTCISRKILPGRTVTGFVSGIWTHATPSHRRKPMHPSLSIHQSHAESGDLWTGVKEQPAQPTGTQGLSMVLWTPKNQTELKASTGFWTILSHYEALWSIMNPTYHQYLTPKLTASCGVAAPSGRKTLKSWAEGRVGYPNQSEVPTGNC